MNKGRTDPTRPPPATGLASGVSLAAQQTYIAYLKRYADNTERKDSMGWQHYIGVKQVEAIPDFNGHQEGYSIRYPDGYRSWSPKATFEAAYLPMGFRMPGSMVCGDREPVVNIVTTEMVEAFIRHVKVRTEGKTTIVHATLANGFELVESSSCVDPANYREEVGAGICLERIRKQVWHLLGFALQWARAGLSS